MSKGAKFVKLFPLKVVFHWCAFYDIRTAGISFSALPDVLLVGERPPMEQGCCDFCTVFCCASVQSSCVAALARMLFPLLTKKLQRIGGHRLLVLQNLGGHG